MFIPTSDAIGGSIGEGVDEILNTTRGKRSHFQGLYIRLIGESAPVVVAFTKSDLAFPHISGSESGNYQNQDRTRTRAYAHCEQLCRSLFRREARDVPAELVSGDYSLSTECPSDVIVCFCSDATIRCSHQQSDCDD
jgi:hypothetical protein